MLHICDNPHVQMREDDAYWVVRILRPLLDWFLWCRNPPDSKIAFSVTRRRRDGWLNGKPNGWFKLRKQSSTCLRIEEIIKDWGYKLLHRGLYAYISNSDILRVNRGPSEQRGQKTIYMELPSGSCFLWNEQMTPYPD
ncbi:uncharacterized protein PADG_11643 [Paracoccidioides brasiliensis Pb18]|uniref:Uncharacterized protein n=1 Tax=Paracoccidioides brasiliensis (strain Pb18) TaxID=502780 RepID=A0A0A0HXH8_PARBD|nr:uncharacterized protein PADG_11643 [Paracoccidioides brasiliensis Pb18]KGM92110.1 hypothetical protein PADG_11643 [Paracoccidioides brasiliensis Pb18]